MASIVFTAYWESTVGVPMVAPGDLPTIRIRRLDSDALVVTDLDMDEVGDGIFKYVYTAAVNSIEYAARADGDPSVTGQATVRYVSGSGDTKVEETWKTLGLDRLDPVEVTPTGIDSDSGDIDVNFSGDGITSTRMERQ
jgi:hypothetical protein